jgi:ribonuclease HI
VNYPLKIYIDGGARGNPGPGASAYVVLKDGRVLSRGSKFFLRTTNNAAEYNGVVLALSWLLENKPEIVGETVPIYMDSQLVARQLSGLYKIKNYNLKSLAKKVNGLTKKIPVRVKYLSVPRASNRLADALVNKEIDENT